MSDPTYIHSPGHLTSRRAFLLGVAFTAVAMACGGCASSGGAAASRAPRNIIIMFGDGAAPTQWDFGRYSSRVLRGQSFATTDVVFREGTVGLLTTSPHGPYVTDSAAAASAMSTGFKVENGAVSVAPDGKPLRTIMQAAKAAGKRIGLVTTATVYDATPAAFSLNAKSRRDSQALVDQYAALEPDVLMGGGADYFLPAGTPGGKRKDGRDIIAAFRAKGYQIARNTAELKSAAGARLLGLFADEDMDFEIDRDPAQEPTTAEMAAAALRALSQQSPNGFVLLVENENTDTAGHQTDAASLMRALWAIDDAVKVALEFQRRNPDTLLIVTGDHETGGFSPTYALKDLSVLSHTNRFYTGDAELRMLERITMSFAAVREHLGDKPTGEALDALIAKHFPGFVLDTDLRALILAGRTSERNSGYAPHSALAMMVARRTAPHGAAPGATREPLGVHGRVPGEDSRRGGGRN